MAFLRRLPLGRFFVAVLTLPSCSLGNFERCACSSADQCQRAYGFGFTCQPDGFCGESEPPPRCTEAYPSDLLLHPDAYRSAIVVGSIFDRSASKQRARERAVKLAVMQANDTGGLHGRPVGLVMCDIAQSQAIDSLSSTQAAEASARYLAQDLGVAVVLGPSTSEQVAAVHETLRSTDTIVISPSATSMHLTALDPLPATDLQPGKLWRTAPPDDAQGPVIAQDMAARGIAKVAVMYQKESYGSSLVEMFEQSFGGPERAILRFPYVGDQDRAETLVSLSTADVQEVLFIASNSEDIIAFLNAVQADRRFDTKSLFLSDAAANADIFRDALFTDAMRNRTRGTWVTPPVDDIAYRAFVADYLGRYGDDVRQYAFAAQAYDATWVALYGTGWSLAHYGSVRGPAVAQGLRHLSCLADKTHEPCAPQALPIVASTWQTLSALFEKGIAVDVQGASGPLDFDPITEEIEGQYAVWVVSPEGSIVPAPIPSPPR